MPRTLIALIACVATTIASCHEPTQPNSHAVGIRPDLTLAPGPQGPVSPSRLLASIQSGGSGGGSIPPAHRPVGAALCLIHEPSLVLGATDVTPLPDVIQSSALIGCDTLITSTGTIVYTAANSPDFAEFNSRITNNTSEMLYDFVTTVDAGLFMGGGGGLGNFTCWDVQGLKGLPPPARGRGQVCNPHRPQDLSGFSLDSIRLVINDFQFSVTDGPQARVDYAVDRTWEFYGHKIGP